MITNQIEVISGDHEPPHPFMIVDRFGMQVDLSRVEGQYGTTIKPQRGGIGARTRNCASTHVGPTEITGCPA